jgi:hypothetical protein
MVNLADFPKQDNYETQTDLDRAVSFCAQCYSEKDLEQVIARDERMIAKWTNISSDNLLYFAREKIAETWRVALAIDKEALISVQSKNSKENEQ